MTALCVALAGGLVFASLALVAAASGWSTNPLIASLALALSLLVALFVIGVEAAELGVALAIILAWHRHSGRLDADSATLLKG